MANKMIFCPQCFKEYSDDSIRALNGTEVDGQEPVSWKSVRPSPGASKYDRIQRRLNLPWMPSGSDAEEVTEVDFLASNYQPYCPAGHLLVTALFDMLKETHITIAVVGNVNSSKSCFINAVFAEIARMGVLAGAGITATTFQSQDSEINRDIHQIYVDDRPLASTRATDEPSGRVLRIQWRNGDRVNLVFYDVSGEVITEMRATATRARHVYTSSAVVMLLDPLGFPADAGYFKSVRDGVAPADPQLIAGLADGYKFVHHTEPSKRRIPFILTVAKADLVGWRDDDAGWPPPQLGPDVSLDDLRTYIKSVSVSVEQQLRGRRMGNLIETAQSLYGSHNVGFSRVTALGRDLTGSPDTPIEPRGTWQVILQILDSLGLLNESEL